MAYNASGRRNAKACQLPLRYPAGYWTAENYLLQMFYLQVDLACMGTASGLTRPFEVEVRLAWDPFPPCSASRFGTYLRVRPSLAARLAFDRGFLFRLAKQSGQLGPSGL